GGSQSLAADAVPREPKTGVWSLAQSAISLSTWPICSAAAPTAGTQVNGSFAASHAALATRSQPGAAVASAPQYDPSGTVVLHASSVNVRSAHGPSLHRYLTNEAITGMTCLHRVDRSYLAIPAIVLLIVSTSERRRWSSR